MPFYEYECSACKFYVEALQKISEPPLRKCPSCKKSTLKRLVSAPVFRLKGAGWYETDFKSDKEEKRNLAGREEGGQSKAEEAQADSRAESKETAAADAKPAAESKKADAAPSAPSKERSGKIVSFSKGGAKPVKQPASTAKRSASPSKAKKPARPAARKKAARR